MKQFLSYILFLISAISVHAQVNLAVISDTRDLQENQQIKLTIILEIHGNEYTQQTPIQLPDFSKFDVVGTASEQNTSINQQLNQIIYQVVLKPKHSGKIKIGSALVTVNDRIYKTEPFDIFISETDKKIAAKKDIDNDLHINLEIKDRNVYENQPTIAVLKAYSKNYNNFRKLNHIKLPQINGVKFHPVNNKKSDIEQNPTTKLASQIIGVYQISTTENGKVEIPAVSAIVKKSSGNSTLKSNNVFLNVKKLPENAPENFKNAIGKFKINFKTFAAENYIVGKPFHADITISGEGNFHSMDLPKLESSPDYTFFAPKIIYNTQNSENGSKGNVVLKYIVIPKKDGQISLKTEDFSFFEPTKSVYENLNSDTLLIAAMTAEDLNNSKSTLDKVNDYTSNVLETVSSPKLISEQLKIPEVHEINYKIIFANLIILGGLAFFVFAYRKKKRRKHKKHKHVKTPISRIENIQEAEERLKKETPIDYDTEIIYLERLKNSKDFEGFFKAYENLHQELENNSQLRFNTTFQNYLSQNNGEKVAEDFRNLNQEIAIEKFAPLHSEDNIDNLFLKLKNIFSKIEK
ncbi:BatD family protein [Halpernia sp.]|uniref:BatD family protein n=1 Tax=Halpernia sp. TaxID=2782209 RepID=UPI003A8DED91